MIEPVDTLRGAWVDDAVADVACRRAEAQRGRVEEIEARHAEPREALAAMVQAFGEAGLLGLVAPAAQGGTFEQVRSVALCLAREALGRIAPLADLAFAMQGLGSYGITARGGDALKARWLPEVAAGRVVAAFALTEPGAGTDVGAIATRATREGGVYVLDGEKTFISNAGVAGLYTLFAVTDPDAPPKRRLSAFAVEADTPGLRAEPFEVLGGHPIGSVHLEGARVPAAARIGEEGEGLSVALGTLHKLRPTVGAAALGFAQRALDESLSHVARREQFGAPLSELSAVQAHLADMACELEAARLLVYRGADAADAGADRSEIARTGSMAKLVATEAAQRIIDRAVQLHGGRGVLRESIVSRLYEDVRALRIYEGTSDVHRTLIARELLQGGRRPSGPR